MKQRISLQLRIDEEAHTKAKEIAKREERTLNSQFEYFIKRCIAQYEAENGPVLPEDEQG